MHGDTINRNLLARFVTITIAEDLLRILPEGMHDAEMFITPSAEKRKLEHAGLVAEKTTGFGPPKH